MSRRLTPTWSHADQDLDAADLRHPVRAQRPVAAAAPDRSRRARRGHRVRRRRARPRRGPRWPAALAEPGRRAPATPWPGSPPTAGRRWRCTGRAGDWARWPRRCTTRRDQPSSTTSWANSTRLWWWTPTTWPTWPSGANPSGRGGPRPPIAPSTPGTWPWCCTPPGRRAAPKGCFTPMPGWPYKARLMTKVHGLEPDDAILMPAPLAHISGLHERRHPARRQRHDRGAHARAGTPNGPCRSSRSTTSPS